MPDSVLPIAEWLPDLPDFPANGVQNIRNVYPRTKASYGAIGGPLAVSTALAARCQGAAALLDNIVSPSGRVELFAGDATTLYKLVKDDGYIWQDISTGFGGPYTVDPADFWEFAYFGGWMIATQISDPVQGNFVTVNQFEDLPGTPPKAKRIAVVKNSFVVLGNTDDAMSGPKSQRVWWSGAGDQSSWPMPGSVAAAEVQSGFFDLLGSDGEVMAIRSGLTGADGIVFQEFSMRRMVYSGPPTIFAFLPAQSGRGTPASQSPVVVGGNCYFLGYDGFQVTDGAACVPIGAGKVDKTFFADLDQNYIHRVVGAPDPLRKIVWWAYPSTAAIDGNPNHLIGYQWELQRWCIVDADCEILARFIGLGYTLDELYTILGYLLDDLPAPLNSSLWVGGSMQFGMFDLNHKLSYLMGPALAPTVETSEMAPIAGRRMMIRGARPLIDGTTAKIVSTSIGHRERLQDPVTYAQAFPVNSLGSCPARSSGRYVRALTRVEAGGDWTNISGVELDVQPQGRR